MGEATLTKPQLMDRAEASGLSNQAIKGRTWSSRAYLTAHKCHLRTSRLQG